MRGTIVACGDVFLFLTFLHLSVYYQYMYVVLNLDAEYLHLAV